MVAISVDPASDSIELRAQLALPFPLLHDEDAAVAAAYGVKMAGQNLALPAVVIVRPDRTIAWRYVGESVTDRPSPAAILAVIEAESDAARSGAGERPGGEEQP